MLEILPSWRITDKTNYSRLMDLMGLLAYPEESGLIYRLAVDDKGNPTCSQAVVRHINSQVRRGRKRVTVSSK